jgi:vancomycin resistance protein YoaR
LSQYETSFAHRAGARAVNIRRGAQLLDGYVLAPHATFSFNRVVGERLEARGFIDAPVIVNDEIDKGVGGGICQVASTLHAAAVYAGLPMLERRSHSRPSGYAPLGLDATVIDGKVDLRFSNPYDEPLLIHASLPTATTMRVEILGRDSEWQVEHAAQVIKRHSFLRRVVEKTGLAPGEFKRSQKGSYGYDIVSVVRYRDPSGTVTTHHYKSNYYPVPEVFWVSPGTQLDSLPPLPEGADGVEEHDPGAAAP